LNKGCSDCDGDGFTVSGGDCNDGDGTINPAAVEICDGLDNDCDGSIDEGDVCDSDQNSDCDPWPDVSDVFLYLTLGKRMLTQMGWVMPVIQFDNCQWFQLLDWQGED